MSDATIFQYKWNLLSPPVWIVRAGDLLEAASVLEEEVQRILTDWDWDANSELDAATNGIVGVYFMLVGFALENLFKAKLIRLNREEAARELAEKRSLPRFLKSHDLSDLAGRAGFTGTTEDETALRLLTRAAVWDGRYPVPAAVDAISRTVGIGGSSRRVDFSELSVQSVKSLIARVRSELGLEPPY